MFAELPHQQHPHQLHSPIYAPQPNQHSSGHGQFFLHNVQSPLKKSNPLFADDAQRTLPRQAQLALPVQSQGQSDTGGSRTKTASQSLRGDMGEHMLRRKTPNGTLSDGYDGTPVDWNSSNHASKYFLTPANDVARYNLQLGQSFGNPKPPSILDSQVMLNQSGNSPNSPWFDPSSQSQPRYRVQNETSIPTQIWLQNASRQPLDSMLYQVPQIPFSYMNSGIYQQVPTVLQPMWPPTIGLTASNAQGRFGPYWPDGSFEPYRPAALRDGQLPPQAGGFNLHVQGDVYHRYQQPPSNIPFIGPPENDLSPWSVQSLKDARRRSGQFLPPDYPGSMQSYEFGSTFPRQQSDPNTSFAHRTRAMSARLQRHGSEASIWPEAPNSGQLAQTAQRMPTSPSNPHFKTRVLIWAHRIYVNLIQHSRRQSQAKSSGEKAHSIFPRPPRQSYSNPRNHSILQSQRQANTGRFKSSSSLDDNLETSAARFESKADFPEWSNTSHRSSFHEKHDRGLRLHQPSQQQPMDGSNDPSPALTYSVNNSAPTTPLLISPQHAIIEAQRALEILDSLCQESNWQWVDGVLLGGCLAYGLEQFQSALQWYERVLACDFKLVSPFPIV